MASLIGTIEMLLSGGVGNRVRLGLPSLPGGI